MGTPSLARIARFSMTSPALAPNMSVNPVPRPNAPGLVPPGLAMLGLALAPPFLIALYGPWSAGAGSAVIASLSLPIFAAACAAPLTLRGKGSRPRTLLVIIASTYFISFAVRTMYLLAFPDLTLFPNFDPTTDLLHLNRGLLWAAAGVYSMTFAYAVGARERAVEPDGPNTRRVLHKMRASSTPVFLFGLYGLGLFGRGFALGTGSALWVFNSPAFDTFSARPDLLAGGVMAILADLCPIAVGALIALAARTRPMRRSLCAAIAPMLLIEVVYFSFGLYKFGLFGVLIIPWISLHLAGRRPPLRIVIPAALALILVVTPVIGAMRENLLGYYKSGGGISLEWVHAIRDTSGDSTASAIVSSGAFRSLFDPLLSRLDGPEALAVAEEHLPEQGLVLGRTYENLALFAVPRILRPWNVEPYYVGWETQYVGNKSYELSVVPMPAIVEAFLNFGWLGVIVVMALLGRLYRFIDSFIEVATRTPLLIGLFSYTCWKMVNIEQNVFIIILPTAKVIGAVVALAVVWSAVVGRGSESSSTARLLR